MSDFQYSSIVLSCLEDFMNMKIIVRAYAGIQDKDPLYAKGRETP